MNAYSDDDNDSRYTLGSDTEEETIEVEEEDTSYENDEDEFEEEYEGQFNFLDMEDEYFDDTEEAVTKDVEAVKRNAPTSRGWNIPLTTTCQVMSMEEIMKEQTIQKEKEDEMKELREKRKKKLNDRPSFNFSDNSQNPRFFKSDGPQKYVSRSKPKYFNPKRKQT